MAITACPISRKSLDLVSWRPALSHSQRKKALTIEAYRGKTVVVVGGFASAWDTIRTLLSLECEKVFVSVTASGRYFFSWVTDPSFLALMKRGAIEITTTIQNIEGNSLNMADGRVVEVDIILLCTGYQFSFPFLPHQRVTDDGRYPEGLLHGVLDVKYPNLAHIGGLKGFSLLQAEFVSRYIKRTLFETHDTQKLEQQLAETEANLACGKPKRSLIKNKFMCMADIKTTLAILR